MGHKQRWLPPSHVAPPLLQLLETSPEQRAGGAVAADARQRTAGIAGYHLLTAQRVQLAILPSCVTVG
jgi:hypothetical protein